MEENYYILFFNYIEKMASFKMPEEEKEKVMRIFKPVRLSKRELFLKEGDTAGLIAFNASGLLRCFYIDKDGNDVTKYFYFENSIVCYIGSILKKESKCYIEALEDCILLCTDYEAFEELIKENYFWLTVIKKLQEQMLIYKEERESSFLLQSATERYVNFINKIPDIGQRINLGYIASYLGISQVSLSRIRKKLFKI